MIIRNSYVTQVVLSVHLSIRNISFYHFSLIDNRIVHIQFEYFHQHLFHPRKCFHRLFQKENQYE